MSLLQRNIAFDELTFVEWRSTDGVVLRTFLLTPQTRTPLLLAGVDGPYDVFAREHDSDWRLVYEIRPQPNGGLIVDWKAP